MSAWIGARGAEGPGEEGAGGGREREAREALKAREAGGWRRWARGRSQTPVAGRGAGPSRGPLCRGGGLRSASRLRAARSAAAAAQAPVSHGASPEQMPGEAGGSPAPADSSESPAPRPGRRGAGRGSGPGRRLPRSFEALRAGKPQEGGCGGGAGGARRGAGTTGSDRGHLRRGLADAPLSGGGGSVAPALASAAPEVTESYPSL